MRILVVAAHPDDTEFICGGTVASMTGRGDEVGYVVVTSGELGLLPGSSDPHAREHEQRAAADSLGVQHIDFLREPDGQVADRPTLRCKIVKSIRVFRPELVITHSPVYHLTSVRYSHPDHLAVGRAALASVFPEARNQNWYPAHFSEGLTTWVVPQVWLCGVERSNFAIDISDQFDRKLAASAMHESQMRHFKDFTGFFRTWALEVAQRHGLADGVLAEEFHRIDSA